MCQETAPQLSAFLLRRNSPSDCPASSGCNLSVAAQRCFTTVGEKAALPLFYNKTSNTYILLISITKRNFAMSSPIYDFEAMRNVDIRTVKPSTLVDIHDVNIDPHLPFEEKAAEYLAQIKNAYCFKCGDVIVKITHAETTTTIDDCIEGFYRTSEQSGRRFCDEVFF